MSCLKRLMSQNIKNQHFISNRTHTHTHKKTTRMLNTTLISCSTTVNQCYKMQRKLLIVRHVTSGTYLETFGCWVPSQFGISLVFIYQAKLININRYNKRVVGINRYHSPIVIRIHLSIKIEVQFYRLSKLDNSPQ